MGQKPAFTMPKEMTASEEYTRAQEQTSLERVFNNLDKKGDGKVHCSGREPLRAPAAPAIPCRPTLGRLTQTSCTIT